MLCDSVSANRAKILDESAHGKSQMLDVRLQNKST